MPNNRNYSRDKKFVSLSHSDKNRTSGEQEYANDKFVRLEVINNKRFLPFENITADTRSIQNLRNLVLNMINKSGCNYAKCLMKSYENLRNGSYPLRKTITYDFLVLKLNPV
jgi:hypothetical protein